VPVAFTEALLSMKRAAPFGIPAGLGTKRDDAHFQRRRRPRFYVCNDFATPDRFWINDGHGHFRAAPSVAYRQTSLSTMAIDVADINRDGFDDILPRTC